MAYDNPDNIIIDDGKTCWTQASSFDFSMKQMYSVSQGNENTSVLVGDLDGDGLPEIVCYGYKSTSPKSTDEIEELHILNGQTGALKAIIPLGVKITQALHCFAPMIAAIVDADGSGLGQVIVAMPGTDNNANSGGEDKRVVKSYKPNIVNGVWQREMKEFWTSSKPWMNPTEKASGYDPYTQPYIADLNGDGVPEVIVQNRIFNAATGAYLGETEPIEDAFTGRYVASGANQKVNFMEVADFDNDGNQEIAAGGKVYKVEFNADKTTVTCKLWKEMPAIADGFTTVADVNLDGELDVVTVSIVTSSIAHIYVWTPTTETLIADIATDIKPGSGAVAIPFVGDIDGFTDPSTGLKYPEICICLYQAVVAYKYNPGSKTFSKKWKLSTTDASGMTGLTLYDFNNDGIKEIVYRDMTKLRILNGVADNKEPVLAGAGAEFSVLSFTSLEFPVIADLNGDGSANILVTGRSSGNANIPSNQRLYAFESASTPWTSAQKVWNQVNYQPLQINEDLTVPRHPIPKNTKFGDDYMYNGSMMQMSKVAKLPDGTYRPAQLASDPAVDRIEKVEKDADTLTYTVYITNYGSINTNIALPVALYAQAKPEVGSANFISSKPIGVVLQPGESATLSWDVPANITTAGISARIQDDGVKFPCDGSLDCNYNNNTRAITPPAILLPINRIRQY
jgi:hypothetical protein